MRGGPRRISSPLRIARVAGILYLAIIVLGVSSDGVIRAGLIEPGNAAETSANILASPGLFRFSLAADSVMVLCDVALAIVLYFLLRPVSQLGAMMAAAFRLVQAAVLGVNLLNQHLALLVLSEHGLSDALEPTTQKALVLLFAEAQGYGYDLGLLFFGVNCILTGFLVFRSGFLPRWIGALVGASGPVYLIGSYLSLLAPSVAQGFEAAYLLPLVGELAFCLWLLIRGVDAGAWEARASLESAVSVDERVDVARS